MEEREICICKCNNIEHQLVFTYFAEDKNKGIDSDVYVSIHLKPDSFWNRLVNGIKYIFGHRSKYGDFDEFIFNKKDADKLQRVVDYLKS